MGFFNAISEGLKKTRQSMANTMGDIFGSFSGTDAQLFEELEEALILADVGMKSASEICEALKKRVRQENESDPSQIRLLLRDIIAEMLQGEHALRLENKPAVVLMIGVNGAGKTTTTGKLAASLKAQGQSVLLAAADTFRAAAIEQLEEWAKRAGAPMIKHAEGSDPAAVIFDAIAAGKARGMDVIICDTAGRLHNKKNLMDELSKISRVISRELPDADKEVLLVVDATTGQNALNQARLFKEAAGLTGIVLTKLDGTAKGGIVIAIQNELGIPVKYIGVGEKIDDLRPFDAQAFATALFDAEE